MAAPLAEYKAVTPFMPSLQHLVLVKIAVPLFEEYGVETLEAAYTDIQLGNSTASEGSTKRLRARENLLYIPAHLRREVMAAVHGSHHAFSSWTLCHKPFWMQEVRTVHWRPDGSIDALKTARDLVRNANFPIRDRFELACAYFFEESVQALWAEMEQIGEAGYFIAWYDILEPIVCFWVDWLREQPRIPWMQSFGTWVRRIPRPLGKDLIMFLRYSSLFSKLRPQERQEFFDLLWTIPFDDLRFCVYVLAKEEEGRVLPLKKVACGVLLLHLEWPLQTLFLETAQKLCRYIDGHDFLILLTFLLDLKDFYKDFKYSHLLEKFWLASPDHLKQSAKEGPLRERINLFFNERLRKRKSLDNGEN